ncbi:MAG TPA: N-acetyltransferase family protein [Stenomitos sp.]
MSFYAARSHRLATLADLPRIVEIYNQTIPSRQVTADLEPVDLESRLSWFAAHQPATRPLWVVEQEGEVKGWLSFSDFYGRPAYRQTTEISLYIDAAARRQGIGTYLLQAAIAHAPVLELECLLAFIFEHNEPSLRLFQNAGFQSWGLLPNVAILDGVRRNLAILGYAIPPAFSSKSASTEGMKP